MCRGRLVFAALAMLCTAVVPVAADSTAAERMVLGERPQEARESAPMREVREARLPAEAHETLALIKRGGPYPYRKDGSAFGNREKHLPLKPHGYYREYTVPTPGARDRGARRIVAGRDGEYYYTDDHYNSFQRIRE